MEKRTFIALAGVLLMLLPPVMPAQESETRSTGRESWELVDELVKVVRLPPGGSYSVSLHNSSLGQGGIDGYSNLTQKALQAVAAVPGWLKDDLSLQFCELGTGMDRYADIINNAADPKYIDEIAFAVAHTSPDLLKLSNFNPGVFSDNAASVYAADRSLDYVNLTEKGDYTTATYTNATGAQVELPRDIYYWYIVHPKITDETPLYIDPANGAAAAPPTGKFWRDYLFNRNDAGYPLLRDALAGVPTLWNGTKNSCADNGAVGVLTKWILDVMDFGSGTERPTQPVRIYALHLGRCGEHEDITAAAARSALIPCIGAEDIAEDHVWNEFWYDGGWHQWEPVNVYVDFPESYGGWGKKFPAVSGWRGDDFVWTETAMYTQTATLRISVKDKNGLPVDGATVWIGSEYSGNPAYRMLASWNSTNETGAAEFQVGKGTTIYARADSEKAGGGPTASASNTGANPWVLFGSDTSQVVGNALPMVYNYTLTTSGALAPRKKLANERPLLNGSYKMEITATVVGSEVRGRSALGPHYFTNAAVMPVYSFITVDTVAWKAFNLGLGYDCYGLDEGTEVESAALSSGREEPGSTRGAPYAVVANDAPATIKTVLVTVKVYVAPYITVEKPPHGRIIAGGGPVRLEGLADGVNVTSIEVDTGGPGGWSNAVFNAAGRNWSFDWDTAGLPSGYYTLRARINDGLGATGSPAVSIYLDADDPEVSLASGGIIKGGGYVELSGNVSDNKNLAVTLVQIWGYGETGTIRRAAFDVEKGTWSLPWQTDGLMSGTYSITVTAIDRADRTASISGNITLDLNAPLVTFGTTGLFRSGAALRLEGTAQDDVELRSVSVVMGESWHNATLDGEKWHFDWDTTGLPSGKYAVTALAEDSAGWNASAASTIELDADAPGIELEMPESAEAGATVPLAGTVRDENGVALAELCTDGRNWTELSPDENGDWSFVWYTSALMPGNFTVSFRAFDTLGNNATMMRTMTLVDTTAPQITLEMTRDIQAGEPLPVKAKLVERTGIERVEYSTDGKVWYNMTPGAKAYTADIDTRTLSLGKNRIRVRAYDLDGNVGEASKDVSVTDEVAPVVTIADLRVQNNSLHAGGNASDNYRVKTVEYTIDNIRWNALELANGSWNLSLSGLMVGKYSLRVRATDLTGKTAEATREFEIEPARSAGKGFIGGFEAALLAAALLLGIGLAGGRKKRVDG